MHKSKTCIVSWGVSLEAARSLSRITGFRLIEPEFKQFANGETGCYLEDISGFSDAILLCSLISPVNDRLVEMLLVADVLNRAGTATEAFFPWLCYSPQDKIFRAGEPLSSEIMAGIIDRLGFRSITTFDIHNESVLDFYSKTKIRNIIPFELFSAELLSTTDDSYVCVALDKGGTQRAQAFADLLGVPMLQLEKSRDRQSGEVTYTMSNDDLKGKATIGFDDYTGSGSTLIKSAAMLKQLGAKYCMYCLTHVFDNGAVEKIENSEIDRVITTNASITSDLVHTAKFKLLDLAPTIAGLVQQ